ncbi:MAG: 30S ribosomal protein S8 [Candidatus Saccharibacteria bacterium]|nr:30S ribosomal protein S8 [Candidatus Saccharibacteria bacterium]
MSKVSTDPIADMLTRIRNAILVRKTEVSLPHSNVKESIATLLKDNGYVDDVKVGKAEVGKQLTITINDEDSNARITEIARVSKPGRRNYSKATKLPVAKRGRGIYVISTSQGLMTDAKARELGVGGEVICKVY